MGERGETGAVAPSKPAEEAVVAAAAVTDDEEAVAAYND